MAGLADSEPSRRDLPKRYTERAGDDEKLIYCRESPNIVASVKKGLTLPLSSASRAEPGTIFLDGVVDGPPFIDNERQVYNLDHHSQCVRLFTLSSCEQAYVLIRSGMDLAHREWKVVANEPDLDTVLALWLIMNHARVNSSDAELRERVVPLVRLEGVIDVHGFELLEFAGLPAGALEAARGQLSRLAEEEIELKKEGLWTGADFTEYTLQLLERVDRAVYSPDHFEDFEVIDELARVTLEENHVAVVVEAELGIYEAESQLRRVHGKRLGVIALLKDRSQYTLRQVKPFLSRNLEPLYALLNLMDPSVSEGNRWGGSEIIGGSPRRTGTSLQSRDIAWAIERAYTRLTAADTLTQLATAAVVLFASLLGAWALSFFTGATPGVFVAAVFVFSLVALVIFFKPYPRLYGIRLPAGTAWLFLLGPALLGAFLDGAWVSVHLVAGDFRDILAPMLAVSLALPCAAEILFRGVVHGLLAETLPVQRSAGKWFLSWPVIGSAALYAVVSQLPVISAETAVVSDWWIPPYGLAWGPVRVGALGAVVFGLAAGLARERSESLLAPVLLHWLAIGAVTLFWMLAR